MHGPARQKQLCSTARVALLWGPPCMASTPEALLTLIRAAPALTLLQYALSACCVVSCLCFLFAAWRVQLWCRCSRRSAAAAAGRLQLSGLSSPRRQVLLDLQLAWRQHPQLGRFYLKGVLLWLL